MTKKWIQKAFPFFDSFRPVTKWEKYHLSEYGPMNKFEYSPYDRRPFIFVPIFKCKKCEHLAEEELILTHSFNEYVADENKNYNDDLRKLHQSHLEKLDWLRRDYAMKIEELRKEIP